MIKKKIKKNLIDSSYPKYTAKFFPSLSFTLTQNLNFQSSFLILFSHPHKSLCCLHKHTEIGVYYTNNIVANINKKKSKGVQNWSINYPIYGCFKFLMVWQCYP